MIADALGRLPDLLAKAAAVAQRDALAHLAASRRPRRSTPVSGGAARVSEPLARVEPLTGTTPVMGRTAPVMSRVQPLMAVKPLAQVVPLLGGERSGLEAEDAARVREALAVYKQSLYRELSALWKQIPGVDYSAGA